MRFNSASLTLVILTINLLLCNAFLSSQDSDGSRIQFQLTKDNVIAIPTVINNQDSLILMFHTAADDVSIISSKTPDLKSVTFTEQHGANSWGGSATNRLSRNNEIQIGSTRLTDIDIWENQRTGHGTHGKIGMGVLSSRYVEVNFTSQVLRLYKNLPAKVENWSHIPLKCREGLIFLPVMLEFDQRWVEVDALIHSGYSGTILLDDVFVNDQDLVRLLPVETERTLMDAQGNEIISRQSRIPKLKIGSHIIEAVPIGFFPGQLGRQKMSVLGSDILKRFDFLIDSKSCLLYLRANDNIDMAFNTK